MTARAELLRSTLFHTPLNPFFEDGALRTHADGALVVANGRILASGDYDEVRAQHPDASVRDLRGGFLLPGLIDTHIHFPQVRVIGCLGRSLLDWLEFNTLPEESRLSDASYAGQIASEFVKALAAHGTTTALVFGAHFLEANTLLFEEAKRKGLRVVSGLVLSDRLLRPELLQTPEAAYRDSKELIRRIAGQRNLHYAVTPRFALSASEAMLEVCQTLLAEHPEARFQSHISENAAEIAGVAQQFPWAEDYLGVYERFGLVDRRTVLAHNVHPAPSALERLAASDASISHCPCSNAALGSGIFPMRAHLAAGVRFALGTDVGGGTGFGMLKEALQSYLLQRVAPEPMTLHPGQLLYLATRAGAEALGLEDETGDFTPGKSADFVYLKPPEKSVLAGVIQRAESPARMLEALITLAGEESVQETRVGGSVVHCREEDQ